MKPPEGFRYIDAHTHLHPEWLFKAIRRWFAEHSDWKISHPTEPQRVAAFLRAHGVERFVFFSYAHKPGISREINRWLRDTGRALPDGIPLATVHAGDEDPLGVVEEALSTYGFRGLKLHIQVQRFFPDDPRLLPIYERLVELDRVLVIHVGGVIGAPGAGEFTRVERFARVLERFPALRASICHMGAPETAYCAELLARYSHLYLDTTMAMSAVGLRKLGYAPDPAAEKLLIQWQDRILFGSDFPNLPYDYEEERRWAWERDLPLEVCRKIFNANVRRFLGIPPHPTLSSGGGEDQGEGV
jgi:predicted TIM-barrel fold metal-dependent hydrolase